MKRKLTALLLLLAVMLPLSACGGGAETPAVTAAGNAGADVTVTEEETTAQPTANLPDTDWEGRDFYVLGRTSNREQFISFEIDAEAENGSPVNDAVYRRNRELEDRYNVTISQFLAENPTTDITKLVSAGDDVYDAALLVQNAVTTPAQSGILLDLYSLPYIDFSQPWWNQTLNDRISINGKLYFTTSDFMLMDKQRTSIFFFNRTMTEDYDLGDLFELARSGGWTVDQMVSRAKVVSKDVDGDGVFTDLDQYGLGMEKYNFLGMTVACGNSIVTKDGNDLPVLSMNTPHMLSTIDKLLAICSDKTQMYYVEDFNGKIDYDYWSLSNIMFCDGRLLFYIDFPQDLQKCSAECVDEYGVIPFPKFDEAQDGYYTISIQAMLITVPTSNAEPEFAAFMLEALSAASRYTTLPAYYELTCKTKYMYDEDSADMLDITFEGLVYDLGILYNWGSLVNILSNDIPVACANNFASLYAKAESKAQTELEKTVDAYLTLG